MKLASHVVHSSRALRKNRLGGVEILIWHHELKQPRVELGTLQDDLTVLSIELS